MQNFDSCWFTISALYLELASKYSNRACIWLNESIFHKPKDFEKIVSAYQLLATLKVENEVVLRYQKMFQPQEAYYERFSNKHFLYASIYLFGETMYSIECCKTAIEDGVELFIVRKSNSKENSFSNKIFNYEDVFVALGEPQLKAV